MEHLVHSRSRPGTWDAGMTYVWSLPLRKTLEDKVRSTVMEKALGKGSLSQPGKRWRKGDSGRQNSLVQRYGGVGGT